VQRCHPRLNDEVGELSIRNHIAEVYWDEFMKTTSSKVRRIRRAATNAVMLRR